MCDACWQGEIEETEARIADLCDEIDVLAYEWRVAQEELSEAENTTQEMRDWFRRWSPEIGYDAWVDFQALFGEVED